MTTPLFPTFRKRITDAVDELIRTQVTPWAFMTAGPPFSVNRFNGAKISYQGIAFEGSPQTVFWGRYIDPFLEDLAVTEINAAVGMARERNVNAAELLSEVQGLLTLGFQKVYDQMADIDRGLRGKGFPDRVNLRSVEREKQIMNQFVHERIRGELVMAKSDSGNTKGTSSRVEPLRPVTMQDFERNLDKFIEDRIAEALVARGEIQTQFIKGGGLTHSRYPITVEDKLYRLLREAIPDAVILMENFLASEHLTYDGVKGPAESRLKNYAQRLVNAVGEANAQMPTLDMNAVTQKFYKEVDDAFRDFEVGFAGGRPMTSSRSVSKASGTPSASTPNPLIVTSPLIVQARDTGQNTVTLSPNWAAERAEALSRLDSIEEQLREIEPFLSQIESETRARIGHNNPPEPIEVVLDTEQVQEGLNTVRIYRNELNSQSPRFDLIQQCKTAFKLLWTAVGNTMRWIGSKADTYVDAAAKSAGDATGKAIVATVSLDAILQKLNVDVPAAIHQITHFLQALF